MTEENIVLKCQNCDIHAVKVYTVVVKTKDVCKKCKQCHEESGFFPQIKVKHNYSINPKKLRRN